MRSPSQPYKIFSKSNSNPGNAGAADTTAGRSNTVTACPGRYTSTFAPRGKHDENFSSGGALQTQIAVDDAEFKKLVFAEGVDVRG
ncbi:hypothetical protein HC928_17905 [bacterium]|nr:hypothetical protein [bacterium]